MKPGEPKIRFRSSSIDPHVDLPVRHVGFLLEDKD
jgi:hypothetical protein